MIWINQSHGIQTPLYPSFTFNSITGCVLCLEETTPTGATWPDSSPNGLDGTLQGGASDVADGVLLDGVDGYVNVPDGLLTMAHLGSGTIIVALTATFGTASATRGIFSSATSGEHQLTTTATSSGTGDGEGIHARVNNDLVSAAVVFSKDVRHVMALVKDGTVGYLYLDGVEEQSGTMDEDFTAVDTEILIGKIGSTFLNGTIHYYLHYSKALTAGEIATFS